MYIIDQNIQAGVPLEVQAANCAAIVVLQAPGRVDLKLPNGIDGSRLYPFWVYYLPTPAGRHLNHGAFQLTCAASGPILVQFLAPGEDVRPMGSVDSPPYAWPYLELPLVLSAALDAVDVPTKGFSYGALATNMTNTAQGYVQLFGQFRTGAAALSVNMRLADAYGTPIVDNNGDPLATGILPQHQKIYTLDLRPFETLRIKYQNPGAESVAVGLKFMGA